MTEQGNHPEGHSIRLYLWVWAWLFVLSAGSYFVDYLGLHGTLRWMLILVFMLAKAGLIVSVFMHMAWERPALTCAILIPPIAMLIFIGIMALESQYTKVVRVAYEGS